ncbi:MAG: substrate-binding domain-containing protein [Candidatus Nanopelagicales bacterium]
MLIRRLRSGPFSGGSGRQFRAATACVAACLLAACTVDPVTSAGGGGDGAEIPTGNIRIAMITHGDDGSFWSIVRRGAQDAAAALDVTLDYQGSAGDAKRQADMINAALTQGAQGLAISAPDIGAITSAVRAATAAHVPVITLNSGSELLEQLPGVITHVGQTEQVAGERAGEALAKAGAKRVLCVLHEVNNIGLQERCAGAKAGLLKTDPGATMTNIQVTGKADPGATAREVGAAVTSAKPDAILTLDPDIAMAALREVDISSVHLATFDLSPGVLQEIEAGRVLFAVDQQPYLQGYLPVTFLALAVRNRNEVGAGNIVLTGPSLVTKDNAAAVMALSEAGTR